MTSVSNPSVEAVAFPAQAYGNFIGGGCTAPDATREQIIGHVIGARVTRAAQCKALRVRGEEIFGPVLGMQTFDDDENTLAHAIDTATYGGSGAVWRSELRHARRFARHIDSGQVGINLHAAVSPETPFEGNRQSGWGRQFGGESLDAYLQTKAVSVKLGVTPR